MYRTIHVRYRKINHKKKKKPPTHITDVLHAIFFFIFFYFPILAPGVKTRGGGNAIIADRTTIRPLPLPSPCFFFYCKKPLQGRYTIIHLHMPRSCRFMIVFKEVPLFWIFFCIKYFVLHWNILKRNRNIKMNYV